MIRSEKEKKANTRRKQTERQAKRSLGLQPSEPLPRCGHWSRSKAEKLAKEGDDSHMKSSHVCELCMCELAAGKGTHHLGVGWCYRHEKGHSHKDCEARATAMTTAIRSGYPARVFKYRSSEAVLEKIRTEAKEAKESISMREEMNLVRSMMQNLIGYFEGGTKPDGSAFTESGVKGVRPASDATLYEMILKGVSELTKSAKLELEITEQDYVHMDEVKVFFGEFARIVSAHVGDELFHKILDEVKLIPEPRNGKSRKK
jgi:hypothetical protein